MTEEIKEMVKEMQEYASGGMTGLYFPEHMVQDLLDYITNLQQDLDKANDIIEKDRQFNQGRLLDVAKLKEENEKLNNKIKEQNLLLIEFQDMEQKVGIYKSRCEKANTYINEEIKKIQEHQYSTGIRRLNKIQNILNRSDENE